MNKLITYDELTAIEERKLLQQVLDGINPYITDHTAYDVDEGDRPTNPRWWLKKLGYDPSIFSYWLQDAATKKIILIRQKMLLEESMIVANTITAQGLNGDITLPKPMKFGASVKFLENVSKGQIFSDIDTSDTLDSGNIDKQLSDMTQKILLSSINQ